MVDVSHEITKHENDPAVEPVKPKRANDRKAKSPAFDPRKQYRPEEIASKLGVSGKIVRGWLRTNYPRPKDAKGSAWTVGGKIANEYARHRDPRSAK